MDCHTVCNILSIKALGGGKTASLSSNIQAYKASGRRQSMSFFVALVAVFCVPEVTMIGCKRSHEKSVEYDFFCNKLTNKPQ